MFEKTNNLPNILNRIESFEIVQCQMHHEKVAIGLDARPLHSLQNDKVIFNRVNLCEIKHRNKRLGCAHSKVNVNFEAILEDLKKILPEFSNQILVFKTEFISVMNQIYALDHKVGNLEHDIAICRLNIDNKEQSKLIKSMQLLKIEHTSLMNELSQIKSDVEQFIFKHIL